jgi:hypothetical protein
VNRFAKKRKSFFPSLAFPPDLCFIRNKFWKTDRTFPTDCKTLKENPVFHLQAYIADFLLRQLSGMCHGLIFP